MGIEVQDEVTVETDYLIVGAPVYTDEDGEPLDEPKAPEELDIYREAEGKSGILTISVDDLRSYFVF